MVDILFFCWPGKKNLLFVSKGAWLIFLPPYSPDFNPIEEAFSAHFCINMRHISQVQSKFHGLSVRLWLQYHHQMCSVGFQIVDICKTIGHLQGI